MSQGDVDRQFFAIIADQIGMPVALVDTADGSVAGQAAVSLWGRATWSGESTPLRFPGQYADPESGLFYNVFRYYNPDTGRYLSPDPLGLAPAPNNYTYPSNPTAVCDPLGLDPGLGTAAGHIDKTDNYLPGLPRDVQPLLGRGSTGAVVPNNLLEQLAMESARSDPFGGNHAKGIPSIGDPRWSEQGWTKYERQIEVHTPLGQERRVTIHYLLNQLTGEIDDFKFKHR